MELIRHPISVSSTFFARALYGFPVPVRKEIVTENYSGMASGFEALLSIIPLPLGAVSAGSSETANEMAFQRRGSDGWLTFFGAKAFMT